ncbi:YtcA family lipoprotein [Dyella japonica]|uniref:Uncharacterized protein YtcA n=1 Tax=Dyella japonica TaxID=231455 RepID=A0ABV2JPP0_9GAMM
MRFMLRCLTSLPATALITACSESPSRNILGSYFPTWMLCALIGVLGVVLVRVVLVRTGVDRELPVPVLVYLSLWIAITLAVWLAWLA